MNLAGDTHRVNWGPNFDDALRACLKSGVVLIDTNRHMAMLTPDARDILGFSSEQDLEVPTSALPTSLVKLAAEVLASGKPGIAPPGAIRLRDARQYVSVTAVPTGSTSLASIVVVTLHTVSASTEFLQRIRQLDRLANAGTLAAGMAHEIKNALVAGRTFLDLLLEKNQEDELAQVVRRETGRIDVIVSRMLRFAGANAGRQSSLPVHDLLDQALILIEPQLDGRSITLQRDFRAATDLIKADEYELHQAFVNLLLNALEAMPLEGTLTVRTTESALSSGQSSIQVEIVDTGSGILPEHLEQVFEPFFTTKAAGTGLGLAVTRRIIAEHGGSISVQSRPDQGTTFVVTLPLVAPPGA